MSDVDDAAGWDFFTVAAWWNLYGLPILLLIVLIVASLRNRSRAATTARQTAACTLRHVGLIHFVLAIHGLLALVQELLTLRVMGIPESLISLVGAFVSTIVNSILAVGFLRRRPRLRRVALVWYTWLSLLAAIVLVWLWYYRVYVDVVAWPEQLVSKLLPPFLLVLMMLPQIKRLFVRPVVDTAAPDTRSSEEGGAIATPRTPRRLWLVSLSALFFLIVVCSNLGMSVAEWSHRLLFDDGPVP